MTKVFIIHINGVNGGSMKRVILTLSLFSLNAFGVSLPLNCRDEYSFRLPECNNTTPAIVEFYSCPKAEDILRKREVSSFETENIMAKKNQAEEESFSIPENFENEFLTFRLLPEKNILRSVNARFISGVGHCSYRGTKKNLSLIMNAGILNCKAVNSRSKVGFNCQLFKQ
jgi:hypothetical protein